MTFSRHVNFALSAITCGFILSSCAKTEPDIPTFDPLDRVQPAEGWKVDRAIAVSPGKDMPTAHHVQAVASGLHDIDFETPPTALTPITPSCNVTRPSTNSGKYLIIGQGGGAHYPLMKKAKVPSLVTFSNKATSKLAKTQAEYSLKSGLRSKHADGDIPLPARNMAVKDVFITETSEPVAVAIASGGLFNFHLAPGVRLTGVVVYTGETAYNQNGQAAVAGVPAGVPVNFISQAHPATKGCWTRVQARPDKSWSKRKQNDKRFKALEPHWKTFYKRVRKDIGDVPQKNVLSVRSAGHYLIGPAPAKYEDRIPYIAYSGKTIQYAANDHVQFGTYDQNKDFARKILDQHYQAHMKAGAK